MPIYLEDHPPERNQFRSTRRAAVTGAIVLHSAENNVKFANDEDRSAENVARFISGRTDAAGSYHTVVDSDGAIRLCRYEWEAYGARGGGNRWCLHLSFACKTTDWSSRSDAWRHGIIEQGAKEVWAMASWVKATVGVEIPWERISLAEFNAGHPGLITHAEVDPGRRSDPGISFPWTEFMTALQGVPPGANGELVTLRRLLAEEREKSAGLESAGRVAQAWAEAMRLTTELPSP